TAVGWCWYTSCAKDGPDSTASGVFGGNTSPSTQDSVVRRSGSSPLDTLTTSAPRGSAGLTRVITCRATCEGADDTMTSAPRTVAARSPFARSVGSSGAPGRNTWFTCSRLMLSATSGSRAHSVTDSNRPVRIRNQQGERHARPERVRRARRGEPHPQREQRRRGERRRGDVSEQPQRGSPDGQRDRERERGEGEEHPGGGRHALPSLEAHVGRVHVPQHRGDAERDREPGGAVRPRPEHRHGERPFAEVDEADGYRVAPAEHAVH